MSAFVDPAVQRLHQLAWRPGAWMNEACWAHLELEPWRSIYRSRPACRPSIDRLIVARRTFPFQPLPASLDAEERVLVDLEPRFFALVTALGVIALACADHLMLRPHREALANHLDTHSCNQLLALYGCWDAHAVSLAPDMLANAAFSAGACWWRRDAHRNIAASLLATLLPPDSGPPSITDGCAVKWIVKLSRFL